MTDFEDIKINLENDTNQHQNNNFEFFNNDNETHNQGNQNINDFGQINYDYGNFVPQNNFAMNADPNQFAFDADPEEIQRQEARKREETERGDRIRKKITEELQGKQEIRDKARGFLENFNSIRSKNLAAKHNFNLTNEQEFLKSRQLEKEGKTNPWDKVIENISLKDSDYKGSKDVTRMKTVILTRKNDLAQMKMR